MKVIKVIVDELPESCGCCPYTIYDAELDGDICMAMISGEIDNRLYTSIYTANPRPVWCPLITTDKLLSDVQSPFRNWEESEE
jgi:hypothetical protein